MRTLIYILAFTMAASASALACPDISGIYISEEGWIIKYEQSGCQQLTRSRGVRTYNGNISFTIDQVLPLNGSSVCNSSNYCEAVSIETTAIRVSLNFEGTARTKHGSCSQNGYSLSKDGVGNLIATYPEATCPDGYQGQIAKILTSASVSLRSELPSPPLL